MIRMNHGKGHLWHQSLPTASNGSCQGKGVGIQPQENEVHRGKEALLPV